MFLLFSYIVVRAQDNKLLIGVSMSGMVSGSGLGHCLSPQLILHNERHSLAVGMNMENPRYNFSGFRGRYEFSFNPGETIEPFLFYDFAWRNKVFLNKQTDAIEDFNTPKSEVYFNTVRLNVIEEHIGLGLNVHVYRSLKIFGAIGAGFYNTLDCDQQNLFKCRENNGFSLLLMIGLKVDLKK